MSNEVIITVNHPEKNKHYNITLDLESPVQALIDEFRKSQAFSAHEKITLVYSGVTLNPKKLFKDYQLQKGSQLDLRTEVLGG